MKTAIICPIGPLDRFGYQNMWDVCLTSMSDFADRVYLIGSWNILEMVNFDNWGNVIYIQNEKTLLSLDKNLNPVFISNMFYDNTNYGCEIAKQDGFDVVIRIDINQYIPEYSFGELQDSCNFVIEENIYFERFGKTSQLNNKLLNTKTIVPFILNLNHFPKWKFGQDCIVDTTHNHTIKIQNLDVNLNNPNVIDVPLELTLSDLADKMNFVKCYSDILPKRKLVFDWEGYWKNYTISKLSKKGLSDLPLDKYGLEIENRSKSEFLSHEILTLI